MFGNGFVYDEPNSPSPLADTEKAVDPFYALARSALCALAGSR
jgi:hypothetical protein